ncbi:MAG: GNAT family N-acetyltransferase [Rhodospirillales bacterium]|nr:GNAT family N-acetyltransferase [Rhodospirillales bacterium]
MTEFVISAIASGDVDVVARIHATCFDEAWDATTIRKIIAMPGAFGLAARADRRDEPVGFALARIVTDECELLSLGVSPDRRQRGIGTVLLDAALVHALAGDAARFYLEVAEDNHVVLRLYEARGLMMIGRRPDYYRLKNGQRTAALTMRCDLPARRASAV